MRGVRDFIDRVVERFLVRFRGLRETAQLSNRLQRRRPDLVVRRRRTEVMECFNGSAHKKLLTTDYADENGFMAVTSSAREFQARALRQPAAPKQCRNLDRA